MLLDLVQNHGNQWKVISLQIGNNKTGQNVSTSADLSLSCCNCSSQCRSRFEKLKRLAKDPSSSLNSSSQPVERDGSSSQDTPIMSPSVNMHEFSSHPDSEPVLPIITPQPRSRAKGKAKEIPATQGNQQTTGAPQPQMNDGTTAPDSMDTFEGGIPRADMIHDINPVASGSAPPKESRKPILQPRPKPRPKGPTKGKISDPLILSENHIDRSGAIVSEETSPTGTMPDPRPNVAARPGKRAKRRASDISDILEAPKSKRAKTTRIADPTLSLAPTELEAPAPPTPTADSRPRESSETHSKQRGRSQKAKPSNSAVEINPEQTVQESLAPPTTDTDAPMMRTRRQSSRLQTAQRRSS